MNGKEHGAPLEVNMRYENVSEVQKISLKFPELTLIREEKDRMIYQGSQSDCQSFASMVKKAGGHSAFKKGLESEHWYACVLV